MNGGPIHWNLICLHVPQGFVLRHSFFPAQIEVILPLSGKYILSGSLDSALRLWNCIKGKAVKRYKVRAVCILALNISSVLFRLISLLSPYFTLFRVM